MKRKISEAGCVSVIRKKYDTVPVVFIKASQAASAVWGPTDLVSRLNHREG
jgi:hypothetical protein